MEAPATSDKTGGDVFEGMFTLCSTDCLRSLLPESGFQALT
jgi:hypothetical protein